MGSQGFFFNFAKLGEEEMSSGVVVTCEVSWRILFVYDVYTTYVIHVYLYFFERLHSIFALSYCFMDVREYRELRSSDIHKRVLRFRLLDL